MEDYVGPLILAGGCAIGAVVWYLKWLKSNYDYIIFDHLAGGPTLALMRDRPDASGFQTFLDELKKRMAAARPPQDFRAQGSIAQQIKELADLKDRGVLSSDEFETAKARLLGGDPRIGF